MQPTTVIVTATFNKSVGDLRAQLALKTVRTASGSGYAIIVVDGSPDVKFKNELSEAGAAVCEETEKGMGPSRRQCIKAGLDTGADIIVWTEPEKYPFIPCISGLVKKMRTDIPHIIVPRRRNLDGYPPYQAFSELRSNHEIGNITGRPDLDLFIGPRVFNRISAEYFLGYKGERGDQWESIFIPVLRALHDGVPVQSLIVDYIHPPEQTATELEDEEMNRKRDLQRESLIRAMQEEAAALGFESVLELTKS